MVATLSPQRRSPCSCKQLRALPLVVTEWQQSFKKPRCPHYCEGACCNPGRHSATAPCPFDGQDLPLDEVDMDLG